MSDYQGSGVWCIAELRHGKLVGTIFELLSAARVVADGQPITAVVIGGSAAGQAAAPAIAERGPDRVLVLAHDALENFIDEAYALALTAAVAKEKPARLLLPSSVMGRSLAGRLSTALGGSQLSDATELSIGADKRLQASRPIFGGSALETRAARRGPEVATVRPMAYPRAESSGKKAEVASLAVDASSWRLRTRFASFSPEETNEIDLSGAERVVSGGRGLGGPAGFEWVRKLAKTLGAGVGASRAAVDSGWIPYRHQVGLTGRTVRPRLYVACGISGQIQHLAGMSASDVIVAINSDGDCPMMKMATFSVQGDFKDIIDALVAEIERQRGDAPRPAAAAAA